MSKIETQKLSIITAATELFSKKGYPNVSVREIAKKADVVPSQIRYYFDSKENLLKVVIDNVMSDFLSQLAQKLNNQKDPEEKIRIFMAAYKNSLLKNVGEYMLITELVNMNIYNSGHDQFSEQLLNRFASIVAKEIFHDLTNNMDTARMFIGSLMGAASWILFSDDWKNKLDLLDHLADSAIELINEK